MVEELGSLRTEIFVEKEEIPELYKFYDNIRKFIHSSLTTRYSFKLQTIETSRTTKLAHFAASPYHKAISEKSPLDDEIDKQIKHISENLPKLIKENKLSK
jgi:hypothetical protein